MKEICTPNHTWPIENISQRKRDYPLQDWSDILSKKSAVPDANLELAKTVFEIQYMEGKHNFYRKCATVFPACVDELVINCQ